MAVPNPPRDERGNLATNRYHALTNLHAGLLGACCACGHTCGNWWRDERGGYTALHERCVDRLIEIWQAMIEEGIGERAPVGRLTGAYARRAAARTGSALATSISTSSVNTVRSVDRGSLFFRPGMPDGAPWVAWGQSAIGRPLVPCGTNEDAARAVVTRWRIAAERDVIPIDGAPVIGGVVIGPDGALSDAWGRYPIPGTSGPWPDLIQARAWFSCLECDDRRWPGCWRTANHTCVRCVRDAEDAGRPSWPCDSEPFCEDPLTVKSKRVRERATAIA